MATAPRPKVCLIILVSTIHVCLIYHRKVTVKLAYVTTTPSTSRPPSRTSVSRPPSPVKYNASQLSSSFRPKAKVNSSATPASARNSSSKHIANPRQNVNVTPRPTSPTKPPPRVRNGTLSPTFQPQIGSTPKSSLRSATPGSPPEPRHRSSAGSSDFSRFTADKRSRNGSISLHHAISFSSLQGSNSSSVGSYSPPLTPTEPTVYSDHERSHSPSVRMKSKVTGMAKPAPNSLSPPSAFPSHPIARVPNHRARTPSVSSSPPTQAPVFYPITTATPAANPHRFTTARPSPHKPIHPPQPFHQPHDDARVDYGRRNSVANVDPSNIPLAPNSPPASAVSFSSHSSVSHSSVSHPTESATSYSDQTQEIEQLRSTLDTLIRYTEIEPREHDFPSQDHGNHVNSADRSVEAEAKSIRKVLILFVIPLKLN